MQLFLFEFGILDYGHNLQVSLILTAPRIGSHPIQPIFGCEFNGHYSQLLFPDEQNQLTGQAQVLLILSGVAPDGHLKQLRTPEAFELRQESESQTHPLLSTVELDKQEVQVLFPDEQNQLAGQAQVLLILSGVAPDGHLKQLRTPEAFELRQESESQTHPLLSTVELDKQEVQVLFPDEQNQLTGQVHVLLKTHQPTTKQTTTHTQTPTNQKKQKLLHTSLINIIRSGSRRALETAQNSRGVRTQVGVGVADTSIIKHGRVGQTGGAGVVSRRVELANWTGTSLININNSNHLNKSKPNQPKHHHTKHQKQQFQNDQKYYQNNRKYQQYYQDSNGHLNKSEPNVRNQVGIGVSITLYQIPFDKHICNIYPNIRTSQLNQVLLILSGVAPDGHLKQLRTPEAFELRQESESQTHPLLSTVELDKQEVQVLFPDEQNQLAGQAQVLLILSGVAPDGHLKQLRTPEAFELRQESESHAHPLLTTVEFDKQEVQVLFPNEQNQLAGQAQVLLILSGVAPDGHLKQVRTPEAFELRQESESHAHPLLTTVEFDKQEVQVLFPDEQNQLTGQAQVLLILSGVAPDGHLKQLRTPEAFELRQESESQAHPLLSTVEFDKQEVQVLFPDEQNQLAGQAQVLLILSGVAPDGHLKQLRTPEAFELRQESESQAHPLLTTVEFDKQEVQVLFPNEQNQLAGQAQVLLILSGVAPDGHLKQLKTPEAFELRQESESQTHPLLSTVELDKQEVQVLFPDEQNQLTGQAQVLLILSGVAPDGHLKQLRTPEAFELRQESESQTHPLLSTVELDKQEVQVLFPDEQNQLAGQAQVLLILSGVAPDGHLKQLRTPEAFELRQESESQTHPLLSTVELDKQEVQVLFPDEQNQLAGQVHVLLILSGVAPDGHLKQLKTPEAFELRQESESQTHPLLSTVELDKQEVQVLFPDEQNQLAQNSRGVRTQVGVGVADTSIVKHGRVGQTGGAGVVSRRVELASWTGTCLINIIGSGSRRALETAQNSRGVRTQVGVGVADTSIVKHGRVGQTGGAGVVSGRVELVNWTGASCFSCV
ncbi:Num1 [Hexamita inflata]|uniref:Num1 n=1 Tax=Hexamita inflata TaxID=28002 RepID=A0AA86P1N3_9EUKA|nr:Num1 [Hexamita inflata]